MHVDVIDSADGLAALQRDWTAVYEADPEAQYFLSWTWMSNWLGGVVQDGIVLAARTDDDPQGRYCAFLPLRLQTIGAKGGGLFTVVAMAGLPVADYTGMLCRPEHERAAAAAFAATLRTIRWREIVFGAFHASERRMRAIVDAFPQADFAQRDFEVVYADGTDHSLFPRIALPGDWESYLEDRLSKETRRKVRRFLRQVDESDDLRVTVTDADTLERDLEIMFRFWNLRWGSAANRSYVERHVEMFRRCCGAGTLYMTMMWQGDRPLGALANLLDDAKKAMLFKIFSRDESFGNPSPGLVLYALAIRHAIERGYAVCDLLQGNHSFKYSFGAENARVFQKAVRWRVETSLDRELDPRCLPAALRHTQSLCAAGRLHEAETNYRQILRIEPQSRDAKQGLQAVAAAAQHATAPSSAVASRLELARQLARAGDLVEATRVLNAVLRLEPENFQARHMLGLAALQRRQFKTAERELAHAARLGPQSAIVHNQLGQAQVGLGRAAEALASFDRAIALKPDLADAHSNRAGALRMLRANGGTAPGLRRTG
ncbi:MAG: GNAT family N-acetyltransferase [Alphaproteobacteria bacterium]